MNRLDLLSSKGIKLYDESYSRTKLSNSITDQIVGKTVSICGRITSIRTHKSLSFWDVKDFKGIIQIKVTNDFDEDKTFRDLFSAGDLVCVEGVVSKTRSSVAVTASDIKMIAPCIEDFSKEVSYGSNHVLEFLKLQEREKFLFCRPKILEIIRSEFSKREFNEVTTPALQGKYGGGRSQPFTSYVNSMEETMFLRATLDLYHKRLVTSGLERVYEVATCFRNESFCSKYSPEFFVLEAYWAYSSLDDMIGLISNIAIRSYRLIYGDELELEDISYTDACKKYLGIKFSKLNDRSQVLEDISKVGEDFSHIEDVGLIHEKVISTKLSKKLPKLTVLKELPKSTSPLMNTNPVNPDLLNRAWLFINGVFIADMGDEVVSPIEQEEKLKLQAEQLQAEGVHDYDNADPELLFAQRVGMPPMSGVGMGVDRFIMALMEMKHVKDAFFFPINREKR